MGKIPPVMKALGIADELIEIESSTIAKVLRPEPDYPNDKQGHNLTMDDVRAVPDLLADPIMVFKSRRREDSYVFFTERKDSKNRSIIIPIAVNKRKGRIIINEITSMYGRNNEIDYVYSNAEGGYLVYMDEKRTKEWEKKTSPAGSRWHRKQYPGERATKLTGLDLNILTKERLVKFISSRQLMVSDGRTYGFVHEGKIYLDPEVMDSNVAVHEYTHLWDKYIQNTNPELWEKGKAVFSKTCLWNEVKEDPAYLNISKDDDLVLSECHARISGNLAQNVLKKIAREDGEITKDRIIDWDKETWEYLAQEFSADMSEFIQVKDFINLPVKDLMASKNISHKRTNTKTINDLGVEYTPDGNIYSVDLSSHLKKTSEQIDEYISKGKLPEDSRFILPPTPDYLLQTGARNTPVTLPVSVVKKTVNVHGFSPMQIKNAIYKLYDPVIVSDTDKTKSENKAESRLILTDEWKDGKPVAIAVNINSEIAVSNGKKKLEVQDIRSIHDRELIAKNGIDLIQKWTKDGLCHYVNDKKISDWSNVARVYFPIDDLQPDDKNRNL